MTTFDDRERAFESKFAHDLELDFRANARRAMWLGLWAAKEMKLAPDAVVSYAKDIVKLDLEMAGHEKVVVRIEEDMAGAGVTPATPVRAKADELLREARESVLGDRL